MSQRVFRTHVEILVFQESLLGQLWVLGEDTPVSGSTELHATLVSNPSYALTASMWGQGVIYQQRPWRIRAQTSKRSYRTYS
jgi:hypothetical protein